MTQNERPNWLTGAGVGALLMAALLAVLYAAAQIIGTPFAPFDLFDGLARVLPGSVIRFGIDAIVSIIAALNLEDTSRSAKTAEHILALLQFMVIGAAAGAVFFAARRRQAVPVPRWPGLVLGALLGLPLATLSAAINTAATALPLLGAAWIVAVFLAWGAALVVVYNRLAALPAADELPPASAHTLNRRQFLVRLGGATATITVVGAGVGALLGNAPESQAAAEGEAAPLAWSDTNPLPNASAAVAPAPGTRVELTPVSRHYRIDINSLPPVVREEDWTLSVFGQVENPLELTLAELRANYEPVDQFITLSCISNPIGGDLIGTQRWTGVPLKRLIEQVKPTINGGYVRIRTADSFHEVVPLNHVLNDERIMLAYDWDGLPLTVGHGFPLRIYIPDLYGMKQPKWIVSLEIHEEYEEGYWVRRNWDEAALVRSTAVIDTVAADSSIQQGEQRLVPVGGIAYAGARGISRVEVKVDEGGDWQPAQLRTPLSDTTWVIWRYDWPFTPGQHTFYVRCVDGNGVAQTERVSDTFPSGATGYHSRRQNL